MALFGEFNITNNYDLSIALESLVKSLGIGLEDLQTVIDSGITITFTKVLSDAIDTPNDSNIRKSVSKVLDTSLDEPTDVLIQTLSKALSTSYSGMQDATATLEVGKALSTSYSGMQDAISTREVSKALATSQSIADSDVITTTKYLTSTLSEQTEAGYVGLNPYAGQDIFAAEYSVGSRESTFTTP
jgi:hypothetical protein